MRTRAGYVIGGALIVAAVAGGILWFVGSLMRLGDEVDSFERVSVPGEATVQLEARKYVVYYEGSNVDEFVPRFRLQIVNARTGEPLVTERYGGSLTYSLSGHEGSAQGTVTPAQAGSYAVRTDGDSAIGANVAFGRSIAWPILWSILGAFAIGGLLFAAGLALIIVTAIRRSRAPRAAPTA
jgi:hypothetical protein